MNANEFIVTTDKSNENDIQNITPENQSEDNLPIFIAGNISGRIFSDGGITVSNLTLTATPYDVTAGQSKTATAVLSTTTDELGQYTFAAVPKASYRICTTKNERFTQSCINVLPPQKTADLKINQLINTITIAGVVSDEAGEPLPNVDVRTNLSGFSAVKTQTDGSYQMVIKTTDLTIPNISFSLKNYTRLSQRLFESTENISSDVVINASLQSENSSGFVVQGRVIDQQGNPARGQRIRLRSSNDLNKSTNYVTSNAEGILTLTNVEPANDYLLNIITSVDYQYNKPENPQTITVADNSSSFTVELEKLQLDYQPMTLFLATQAQQPISGITLSLSYRGKRIARAVTDASGSAVFDRVPSGSLSLSVNPLSLRVTGLSRENHNGITIAADKGDNEARINVTGTSGEAVVCRQSTISFSQRQSDLQVNTSRSVQSDQAGVIYATDFGSGEHTLNLSKCDGYKNYRGSLNIGVETDFSVTLNPL